MPLPPLPPEVTTADQSGKTVKLNDRVRDTKTTHEGWVRYIGPTEFKDGIWVGVELDLKVGLNDGSKQSLRYFYCNPGHGKFLRPNRLRLLVGSRRVNQAADVRKRLDEPTRSTPLRGSPFITPTGYLNVPGLSPIRLTRTDRPRAASPTQPGPKGLRIGCRVIDNKGHRGVVKYIGFTNFLPGEWVGLSLDEPYGKNDGSIQGQRYFECPQSHGRFVRPHKVVLEDDEVNKQLRFGEEEENEEELAAPSTAEVVQPQPVEHVERYKRSTEPAEVLQDMPTLEVSYDANAPYVEEDSDIGTVLAVNATTDSLVEMTPRGVDSTLTNLRRSGELHDETLSACLRPHFAHLDLADSAVTNAGIRRVGEVCGAQLLSINVAGCEQVTGKACSILAKHALNLTSINLRGCSAVDDGAVLQLLEACPRLEKIGLGWCGITDLTLRALASHPVIDLDISGCNVTDGGVSAVLNERGAALRCLNVSFCAELTDASIGLLETKCRRTERLGLEGCRGVSHLCIVDALSNSRHLKEILLSSCSVDDTTLEAVAKLPNVTHLEVAGCGFSDVGVVALARGCPRLRALNISDSSATAHAIAALESLENLRSLDVTGCPSVTENALVPLYTRNILVTDDFEF